MPPSSATLPSAADALTALNAYQVPDSASVLAAAQQQYGVNDLQQKVNAYQGLTSNLTNSIAAVDPSVTGQTAGTLTTEGQRSALVDRERTPLVGQLGTVNDALNQTNTSLTQAQGNAKDSAAATESDDQQKYNQLLQTYNIANAREQAAQQSQADQAKQDEAVREFNVSQANANANSAASNTVDPASGYSVKQLSSGNKAYTGPNGQTNLYQYASAMAGGDPSQTYNIIKQQLSSGSATDKGAAAGMTKLEQQGLSQDQIIARLKSSNAYIFN